MSGQHSIFVGYRRDDTGDVCGRAYEYLQAAFGRGSVFKDVEGDIPPGAPFDTHILNVLAACRVFLAMIGPGWLDIRDTKSGLRRLDDPTDWVRIELETALKADGLQVVPVLINGAPMPVPEELPESLRKVTRLQAVRLRRDPDFHRDIGWVISKIGGKESGNGLDFRYQPMGSLQEAGGSQATGDTFDRDRYVFISYPNPKHQKFDAIRLLIDQLVKRRISTWIYDPIDFALGPELWDRMAWQEAGEDWEGQTIKALQGARKVLAFVSRRSLEGGFQTEEIRQAAAAKRLVACLVEDIPHEDLPDWMTKTHVTSVVPDASDPNVLNYRIAKLVREIEAAVAGASRS